MTIRLTRPALEDLRAARDWYEAQAPGLGDRLVADLKVLLRQLETFPERHPVVHREVRRALLKNFPYAVFYQRRGADWFVLAIVHHAREPRTWQQHR